MTVADVTLQQRLDTLSQRIAGSRRQALDGFEVVKQTPARVIPAFSFTNAVYESNTPLDSGNKDRLAAVLESLNNKKLAAQEAVPQLEMADTGTLSPSPKNPLTQPNMRAKINEGLA